jgi:hypothetical protein
MHPNNGFQIFPKNYYGMWLYFPFSSFYLYFSSLNIFPMGSNQSLYGSNQSLYRGAQGQPAVASNFAPQPRGVVVSTMSEKPFYLLEILGNLVKTNISKQSQED